VWAVNEKMYRNSKNALTDANGYAKISNVVKEAEYPLSPQRRERLWV
jgi:hypothetical protein